MSSLNDYIGWGLAILLFVAGIIASFYLGRRNRQRPEVRYARATTVLGNLSSVFGPKVRITFDNKELPMVGRSHVAIWNHRGDHVESSQVAASDPIVVTARDGEVLQARVVSSSRDQIQLRPEIRDNAVHISFDFLDHNDGGIVEVIHSGSGPIRVQGTIRGADLRSVGGADLGPQARAAVRASRFGRISFMNHSGKRRVIYFLATGIMGLALFVVAVVVILMSLRDPQLVDATVFNLSTISGQSDFASAVRGTGKVNYPVIWMSAGMGVAGLFLFGTGMASFWTATRAAIPQEITRNDIQSVSENDDNIQE